ncbi:acetyl/propionyl/methylcrotonyl-CoA carboxylase subunit alpha [Vibrio kasasachensis]|uniref:acetyl/propionyl/methylcrotonyl-CoA carboxylase subunit alpha n=1 Tax=Vibrio kasasachensis TaxID=2910248 RepID=UPI003D0AB45C
MFKRILIANRGEIACRVIKTAKKMAIETVAVYSDADRRSLHVKQADFAEYIGASPASESYLDVDKIIQSAIKWKVDAVHPGYGFLSENAILAKACSDNNIIFIGPPTNAIEQMGSKSQAKSIMATAKVPLVPGYHGDNNSVEHLLKEADKIGYPVMLKATQGGGGKGMRVVNSASEMNFSISSAQREALSSFGDKQLLIEKCIIKPRHVEVQVFADQHGNCLYLSDRDCSIQRRHQKVVEEAPAPGLSDQLRKKMGEAAVLAAKAIDYVGAGTVEFLLDNSGEFYFMEMNTRLQVEHPVTELITGIDLVEWQFNVAAGEQLPMSQQQITHTGHAIELRIYAEDAQNEFMPSTGKITYLSEPSSHSDVRIDSGVIQDDVISEFYDPMISKLIVWGDNRNIALARLKQALNDYHLLGVTTNIGFLHSVICQPAFANLELDTDFLIKHQNSIQQHQTIDDSIWLTLAAIARWSEINLVANSEGLPLPTQQGFRLSPQRLYRFNFTTEQTNSEVILSQSLASPQPLQSMAIKVEVNDHQYDVCLLEQSNKLSIDIDGVRHYFHRLIRSDETTVFYHGQQRTFAHQPNFESKQETDEDLNPTAPLNGIISAVLVNKGEQVATGTPLLVLEAMKMEYTISASQAVTVEEVFYQLGEQVQHGSVLLQLSPNNDDSTDDMEVEHATRES